MVELLHISLPLALAGCLFHLAYLVILRPRRSHFAQLTGPKPHSFLTGDMQYLDDNGAANVCRRWNRQYGDTYAFTGLFGAKVLMTSDPVAINHIFNGPKARDYGQEPWVRRLLANAFGKGVLAADGEVHKQQRHVLAPAFSTSTLNDHVPIFRKLGLELAHGWDRLIAEGSGGKAETNLYTWASAFTSDGVNLAGFGNDQETPSLRCLAEKRGEEGLVNAFRNVFRHQHGEPLAILEAMVPILRWLPTKRRKFVTENELYVEAKVREMVRQQKKAILENATASRAGLISKHDIGGKDILTLLVKANLADDLKPSERLDEETIVNNVALLYAAGQDTTANTIAFLAHKLVMEPTIQTKLREELRGCSALSSSEPEELTAEKLARLPYLDGCVMEALRLFPAGHTNGRAALKDDVIPFGSPVVLADGSKVTSLRIRKGETMAVPMLAMQTSKDVWGADAEQFRPERWINLPEAVKKAGGWRGIGTFSSGPRMCLGMRFAYLEMQTAMASMVHDFVLSEAAETKDVISVTRILQKPYVAGDLSEPRMPVVVSRYEG